MKCFEEARKSPPAIGSIVSVKHNGCLSSGVLRNPIFWRERIEADEAWNSLEVNVDIE